VIETVCSLPNDGGPLETDVDDTPDVVPREEVTS
jgi:hypothetical protein